jgi:hypothetical protein
MGKRARGGIDLAAKTNTEKINDLSVVVAAHQERLNQLRRDFDVFERAIDRLDRAIEETNRKLWYLTMVLIGAILALVGTLVSVIVRF